MRTEIYLRKRGFTLLETVIAIGVLAVLLTGFMIVFAPAAAGIRKAIDVQQADRLASTLERELVTVRPNEPGNFDTGFEKAFEWIQESNNANDALLVYQYRGNLSSNTDGVPDPVADVRNKIPGEDYTVQTMVRRKGDQKFLDDLPAIEGAIYLVKCTQLTFQNGELKTGTAGSIKDPKNAGTVASDADDYPEAVIAFAAEFYSVPSKASGYFSSKFNESFKNFKNPVFTRNLAVRR